MAGRRGFGLASALLVVAVAAVACSKKTSTATTPTTSAKPSITVGTVTFAESQIVAEMFAAVLQKAGYHVTTPLTKVGQREILQPSMPGQIQLAPEYVGSLLAYLKGNESSDPVSETAQDNVLLAPKGLTVLDASGANDTNAFVVTKDTATKYSLTKVSDLKPVATQLTLGGPAECATRPLCLLGLQNVYGIKGLKFQPIGSCDTPTANALDSGAVQVALLCSTQSVIAKKGWVVLQDDKNLQPADNIAAEVSTSLLNANPEIRTLLTNVTQKLTTANIVGLNAMVEIDHQDASAVAQAFLKANGLL